MAFPRLGAAACRLEPAGRQGRQPSSRMGRSGSRNGVPAPWRSRCRLEPAGRRGRQPSSRMGRSGSRNGVPAPWHRPTNQNRADGPPESNNRFTNSQKAVPWSGTALWLKYCEKENAFLRLPDAVGYVKGHGERYPFALPPVLSASPPERASRFGVGENEVFVLLACLRTVYRPGVKRL